MNILKGIAICSGFGAATYYVIKDGEHRAHNNSFVQLDPDPTLRRQEKDVLIPSLMRKTAQEVDCAEATERYRQCCTNFAKDNKWSFMIFKECREESKAMMNCMNDKFVDPEYYYKCKQMYVDEKYIRHTTKLAADNRKDVKECVEKDELPKFHIDEDTQTYMNGVKEFYQKTQDVEAYDQHILTMRQSPAPAV